MFTVNFKLESHFLPKMFVKHPENNFQLSKGHLIVCLSDMINTAFTFKNPPNFKDQAP